MSIHSEQAILALCIVLASIRYGDDVGLHFPATICQGKALDASKLNMRLEFVAK